jgi:S1-C subfamily serine protease
MKDLNKDSNIYKQILGFALAGLAGGTLVIGYLQFNQTIAKAPAASPSVTDLVNPSAFAAAGVSQEQQVINLYKQVSSSVVNVTTRSFKYNYFMELVPSDGAGSGFVIDKAGHVVTNFHVVNGAQRFFVAFGNVEHSYPAELVGFDQRSDLAILKVKAPPEMLNAVTLGDSAKLEVGQTAVAIGNPFGLGQTMTSGVVSSLGRKIQVEEGRVMSDLIQTDAAINSGNSGGPLFNSAGQVIGVNTLIYSPSGGSVGVGFAIPINTVKRFIPDLLKYGKAQYPWMGVSVVALSPRLSQLIKLPVSEGLLVMQTAPNGSAAQGGIQGGSQLVDIGNYQIYLGGDIILAVDGQPVKAENDLINYLESHKRVGDTIQLTILKGGKGQPVNLNIRLTTVRNTK